MLPHSFFFWARLLSDGRKPLLRLGRWPSRQRDNGFSSARLCCVDLGSSAAQLLRRLAFRHRLPAKGRHGNGLEVDRKVIVPHDQVALLGQMKRQSGCCPHTPKTFHTRIPHVHLVRRRHHVPVFPVWRFADQDHRSVTRRRTHRPPTLQWSRLRRSFGFLACIHRSAFYPLFSRDIFLISGKVQPGWTPNANSLIGSTPAPKSISTGLMLKRPPPA